MTVRMTPRRLLGGRTLAVWLATASAFSLTPLVAQAQSPFQPPLWGTNDATPSFRVVKGTPVAPTAAVSAMGPSTDSHDGICRDNPSDTTLCPSGGRPRPVEIVDLAQALHGDPDLIFEYVRNKIDIELIWGSNKGALGTMLDKSGGSFDQAVLMVELLRQSSVTARYRFGDISLTGAQFTAWTGISDARVACETLAAGGIPATVNGATTCGASGALTTVVMGHVWVEAVIGGQTYQFDPAFKAYDNHSTIDVRAGMGLTPGELFDDATASVTHSGDGRTSGSFSLASVKATMDERAAQLATRLHQADVQGASLSDVLGGRDIVPGARPVGGWRSASLSYASQVRATWTGGVPDQYRTLLTLNGVTPSGRMPLSASLFLDEAYGRPVEMMITGEASAAAVGVFVDHVKTHQSVLYGSGGGGAEPYNLTVGIDHPFAAESKQYGDQAFTRASPFSSGAGQFALVLGVGRTSTAQADKLVSEGGSEYPQLDARIGARRRNQLGPAWLAQFSKALWLQARVGNQQETPLHTIGFSFDIANLAATGSGDQARLDVTNVLDLDTTIALTSIDGSAAQRRATIHAIALTAATLEGSVSEQSAGSPDSISTARRFANLVGAEEEQLEVAPNRLFRRVNAAEALPADNQYSSGVASWTYNVSSVPALQSALSGYHAKGYDIVVALDALMGPGSLYGSHDFNYGPDFRYQSTQRGGAFTAVKYDSNGDPIAIANVTTNFYTSTKGGGGNEPTTGKRDSADLLKDRFVDRSTMLGVDLKSGATGYTSPVVASRGNGEFPFRLDETLSIRGSSIKAVDRRAEIFGARLQTIHTIDSGLVSNFDGSAQLSGSGLEAMGRSRPEAAASTIAAFVLLQDIFTESPSQDREVVAQLAADWWGRKLVRNVVTVSQGAATEQFVEAGLEGGSRLFLASSGGPARVLVTGDGVNVRPDGGQASGSQYGNGPVSYRTHLDTGVAITYHDGQGNRKVYDYWRYGRYQGTPQTDDFYFEQGFRLKTWIFANGVVLTPTYSTTALISETAGAGSAVPVSISSNLGYTLNLSSSWNPGCDSLTADGATYYNPSSPAVLEQAFTDAAGKTYRVVYRKASPRGPGVRQVDSCQLIEVYTPLDTTLPSLRYTYDGLGRVKTAADGLAVAGSRPTHKFFYADGYRGEREDPTGARYAVEWQRNGHVTRTTDELGRVSTAELDGRGRAVKRTYPEGDWDGFVYDARSNLLSITRNPKPGSPLAATTTSMTFGEASTVWACVNWVTCNKPVSLDGPRTDVTDVTNFSWNATTGDLTQILKPADGAGVRPQIDLTYTANPAGISLLTSRIEKITAASTVETTFDYDAANFYVLKSSTVDPAGLALKTCFQINGRGDIVGVSDARTVTCPVSPP